MDQINSKKYFYILFAAMGLFYDIGALNRILEVGPIPPISHFLRLFFTIMMFVIAFLTFVSCRKYENFLQEYNDQLMSINLKMIQEASDKKGSYSR